MAAKTCPGCGGSRFYDKRSHRACADCGFVGWSWDTPVDGVGAGKGYECSHCGTQTFHAVGTVGDVARVYRCATCTYAGVEPLDDGTARPG